MHKRATFVFYFLGYLMLSSTTLAETRYFLCGPNEDGCSADQYAYCFCIPYDESNANQPYCLNFDNLSCLPVTTQIDCHPAFLFKNQGECLATIFHSHPGAPCDLTHASFCKKHFISMCDKTGQPNHCIKPSAGATLIDSDQGVAHAD